ncbi:hypothetical protein HPB48_026628 [Haemaphysalis longicornis]|uniref:Uncharacterized protein n=1 Tax=Haemaphysalis longicornis TaxID=44386 RepID=A0A9J6HAA4_HAELO|nr:hypothetical protein HPB48_026628 [Haemaphysalis longicornis]
MSQAWPDEASVYPYPRRQEETPCCQQKARGAGVLDPAHRQPSILGGCNGPRAGFSVLHFNENVAREQEEAQDRTKRYRFKSSKSRTAQYTGRPVKEKRSYSKYQ